MNIGINSIQENTERLHLGDKAQLFLKSSDWKELVVPILESMVKGLSDIHNIDIDSLDPVSAKIEIKARKLAAEYIESIDKILLGYVDDANVVKKILERASNKDTLYEVKEAEE